MKKWKLFVFEIPVYTGIGILSLLLILCMPGARARGEGGESYSRQTVKIYNNNEMRENLKIANTKIRHVFILIYTVCYQKLKCFYGWYARFLIGFRENEGNIASLKICKLKKTAQARRLLWGKPILAIEGVVLVRYDIALYVQNKTTYLIFKMTYSRYRVFNKAPYTNYIALAVVPSMSPTV